MASKKEFINPLTRSSELDLNLPAQADNQSSSNSNVPSASSVTKLTKDKGKIFEETHQRFTSWIDKKLKKQFDELAAEKGVTKSALLNEAIIALLHKQERKPYTRRNAAD